MATDYFSTDYVDSLFSGGSTSSQGTVATPVSSSWGDSLGGIFGGILNTAGNYFTSREKGKQALELEKLRTKQQASANAGLSFGGVNMAVIAMGVIALIALVLVLKR